VWRHAALAINCSHNTRRCLMDWWCLRHRETVDSIAVEGAAPASKPGSSGCTLSSARHGILGRRRGSRCVALGELDLERASAHTVGVVVPGQRSNGKVNSKVLAFRKFGGPRTDLFSSGACVISAPPSPPHGEACLWLETRRMTCSFSPLLFRSC